MTFATRVKALNLPLSELVVIGSGLVEQWGFREAADIDLVVSPELFERLRKQPEYQLSTREGEAYLQGDGIEIWQSFAEPDRQPNFAELLAGSQVIDGVHFVATDVLIAWKRAADRPQDRRDVEFLERRSRV